MNINEIKEIQDTLKSAIYNQYLCGLKDFSNDSSQAYSGASYSLRHLIRERNFNGFTRRNNIRGSVMQTFGNSPENTINYIILAYLEDLSKNPNSITTEDEANLYNAIIITQRNFQNINKNQAFNALKDVMLYGNYTKFSRKEHNSDSKINARGILINTLSPEKIIGIISDRVALSAINEKTLEANTKYSSVQDKINSQYGQKISNFQINPSTVNLCREHILAGKQFSYSHADYHVGKDLQASTDVGLSRKKQEDSVVILTHPANPSLKMLVVADGMGGLENGELASSYVTKSISEWFENISSQYYDSTFIADLSSKLNERLNQINNELVQKFGTKAGSTFVGAIVTDKQTLVTNVGDSRAYVYTKDGNLSQISVDDNVSFNLWKAHIEVPDKDAIRFHKNSNMATQGLGGRNEEVQPHAVAIPNESYQTLMLFSDGITDCLSDDLIKAITKYTPRDELARTLVHNAKYQSSYRTDLDPNAFYQSIKGGKDNSTAAVFDKRNNDSDGR